MPDKSIQIDLQVHKYLENQRVSFDETYNHILRRILGIEELSPQTGTVLDSARGKKSWHGKGVTLPHGTKCRMTYKGQQGTAEIDDGAWLVNSVRKNSPSAAAIEIEYGVTGNRAALNGWNYWEVSLPGSDRWIDLRKLWERANH